ncbi:MAG: lytic transglycosylase domain-containing protein, partial [Rhodospirillales bacterium]
WRAMRENPETFAPKVDPTDGRLHGPSIFKDDDHPNRFIETEQGVLDSKSGELVEKRTAALPPLPPEAPTPSKEPIQPMQPAAARDSPPTGSPFTQAFEVAGRETGVDPALLAAVQEAETGGERDPVRSVSEKNARGVMQLRDAAIQDVGGNPARAFDPETNILYAARYLKQLQDRTGSDEAAVTAYHQGIDDYLAGQPSGPKTTAYVQRVMDAYRRRRGEPEAKTVAGQDMGGALTLDEVNRRLPAGAEDGSPVPSEPSGADAGQRGVYGVDSDERAVVDATMTDAFSNAARDLWGSDLMTGFRQLVTGYKAGGSSMYHSAANLVALIKGAGDWLREKTGVGVDGSEFKIAEDWLRGAAERMAPAEEEMPKDFIGKVNVGVGSAPAAIAELIAFTRGLGGPVQGFAASEALREADKGPEAAAKGAAKGALLGGAFKAAEPLSRP